MAVRRINIGDKVICNESGVIGRVIRFYIPTACEEQTMVVTEDGRRYHAPKRTWVHYKDGAEVNNIIYDEGPSLNSRPISLGELIDNDNPVLKEYGDYIINIATTRGISVGEAISRASYEKINKGLGVNFKTLQE